MWPFIASWAMDINTDPSCGQTVGLDMLMSLGLNIIIATYDRTGHRDWYGSNGDVTLRCQHGSWQQPRTLASAWPLMVSEATDINTDPECSRATDSDMAPLAAHAWKSPWHLVPVQAGHSDLYDRGCSMTLRSPTGLRRWYRPSASPWLWWQHRSWISTQTPATVGPDTDMVLGRSPQVQMSPPCSR